MKKTITITRKQPAKKTIILTKKQPSARPKGKLA